MGGWGGHLCWCRSIRAGRITACGAHQARGASPSGPREAKHRVEHGGYLKNIYAVNAMRLCCFYLEKRYVGLTSVSMRVLASLASRCQQLTPREEKSISISIINQTVRHFLMAGSCRSGIIGLCCTDMAGGRRREHWRRFHSEEQSG